jgi:hypothetical protein
MKVIIRKSSLLFLLLTLVHCVGEGSNIIKEVEQENKDTLSFSEKNELINDSIVAFYIDIIFKTQYVKDLKASLQDYKTKKVSYIVTLLDSSIYDIQVGIDSELKFTTQYTFRCNTIDSTVVYLDYFDNADIQVYPIKQESY